MFRTYQVLWNRLSQLIDAGNVILGFVIAWYIKFRSGWLPFGGHYSFFYYLPIMMAAVPLFLLSNWVMGLYRAGRSHSFWRMTSVLIRSLVLGTVLFMSFLYIARAPQFSRSVLLMFSLLVLLLNYLKYVGVQLALRIIRTHGYNKRYVVIVGWTEAANRFIRNLQYNPWFGYHVFGYVSNTEATPQVPYLGDISSLKHVLEHNLIDNVLICLPRTEASLMLAVVAECESAGIQSLIVPDYFDILPANPRFENFAGMPLIDTRYVPLDDAVNAGLKRVFDIVFSVLVLVVLSPLYTAIAIGVKLTSPGPVLFRQERAGRNRRTFRMYKFRTMVYCPYENQEDDGMWTVPNDPRCTKFGRFLRKTSLDELPQFWNVLLGDMSIIGPRPERPGFVERFREEVPRYMVKHRVRPGITGWAQVHGWRGDTSIQRRIDYDLQYIENWSFSMDLKIVIRTIRGGFRKNAY
ncbi:UDP-phosphate glucose phosphotransferase [Alicyclobacillus ferrooxydans]|uniref:UDP-phosphate glucose phosphotransferase n=1 Tax=Alicyclobacillus ferrooxydans TaxID=471514 RepID=A0A0P9CAM1_9BACL|nr:undecaprenyl-phosphate glucose phosphotransferase [Alicyclobacillus ferrooxydans]KPV42451.1 UDP-phosphate glucose phosphotransferase [Alicyclobacillus ferrooxydans]